MFYCKPLLVLRTIIGEGRAGPSSTIPMPLLGYQEEPFNIGRSFRKRKEKLVHLSL